MLGLARVCVVVGGGGSGDDSWGGLVVVMMLYSSDVVVTGWQEWVLLAVGVLCWSCRWY